jgi:hypothetical protein
MVEHPGHTVYIYLQALHTTPQVTASGRTTNRPPPKMTHPNKHVLLGILDCLAAHSAKLGVALAYTSAAAQERAKWATHELAPRILLCALHSPLH